MYGWIAFSIACVVLLGVCVENVTLTSDNVDLRDALKETSDDNKVLQEKVERLLDDVTTLASRMPKHGPDGKFQKR